VKSLFLVIERDIRLFFQYKFMIIMRAIWFVSQIALFGLIASGMISVVSNTLTQSSIHLEPYQTNTFVFQINATIGHDSMLMNLSSAQGQGDAQIFFPNGSTAAQKHFDSSVGNYSYQLSFDNPSLGVWSVKFLATSIATDFSVTASSILDYFRYYVAGLSIMTLYSAALFIGFDLYEEAEHGVFEYLLSLPVSRKQLALGRSIGGGLRAFIYVGPLVALSLYFIGSLDPPSFLISMLALFLFAFGASGMSITLAVLIKSSDRFDILMGVLDALIVRLSTAMYPLAVMKVSNPFYASVASLNPITFVTDLFRWGTAITTLDNPLIPLLGVFAFFGFFTLVGVTIYDKRIEGGGWK
jgi:ABC-2 type transport system permease protein